MSDKNFEEFFLKGLVGKKIAVYLASGIKLSGKLLDYNDRCVLIEGTGERIEGKPQLVYLNSVSTILPNNL